MDSFVEAQNNLKRISYAGCVILFKTRQSHAVRFSFIPMVMKSPGLKPIEAQNPRSSSACGFLTWLLCARSGRSGILFGRARPRSRLTYDARAIATASPGGRLEPE